METEINNQQVYNILSIDGGGIKVLYTIYMLQHFENVFCKPYGKRINQYFDMFCGTSGGGIVALSLACDISIDAIAKIFEDHADKLFPGHNCGYFMSKINAIYRTIKMIFGAKYDNKALIDLAYSIFGEKTLQDIKYKVCIPSFCLDTSSNVVFGSNNFDKDVKLVDVILATSAAPTYFPVHFIPEYGHFVDGGIWANNPSFVGIDEALKYYVGKTHRTYRLLSLGNINTKPKSIPKSNKNYWNILNIPHLVNIMFDSDSQETCNNCRIVTNYVDSLIVRITANDNKFIKFDNDIALDDADKKVIATIKYNSLKYSELLTQKGSYEYNRKKVYKFFE